jgi:two-component system sensor histidine kinase TctE
VDAVLDNLIDNAFRYGQADANPKITVSVVQLGSEIHLTVTDNGRGLTQQEASHYKGRWAQASEVRSMTNIGQGVGLGLAIVSRYAELLGAKFILQAASGEEGQSSGLCAGLMFAVKS